MVKNIKGIRLWDNSTDASKSKKQNYNNIQTVLIEFAFPCTWTALSIDDLKQILRVWIKGEELVYPRELGYQGRWLLFKEIQSVFNEVSDDEQL